MNDADRLQQVESLFHDALARPLGERAAFLNMACAADPGLLAQVNALLVAHERSGSFMETPVIAAAVERLGATQAQLQPGQRLGAYAIVRLLGRGGMGEVYIAEDARLARQVALKLLPVEFAGDADRRRRFEQEARAAGMLNHPNIVTVYDFGIHDGLPYIITELLEGQTLRARLKQDALPPQQAADYALQIARGLAAAHEKGVVHRDLKPENLFLTKDGRVKILDFGLAKLQRRKPLSNESTGAMTPLPETNPGMVMGTVGYMAPEQLREQEVDHRADIFVFGVVLYEMLTGARAFAGTSLAEVMSAILKEDPPELTTKLRQQHPALTEIVRRCLFKNPAGRFQSADEIIAALETGATPRKRKSAAFRPARAVTLPRWQLRAAVAGLLLIGVAAVLLSWWLGRRPAPPRPSPILKRITSYAGLTTDPAISLDGKLIAYASDRSGEGNLDIWVQQVGGGEAIRLTHSDADEREPAFSPDGSQIAFRSERDGGGIYISSALGGEARLIAKEGRRPRFSPDGKEIAYWIGGLGDFVTGAGKIYVVAATGGPSRQLQPDFDAARFPIWSPDGKQILFIGVHKRTGNWRENLDFWVMPAGGGAAVKTGVYPALLRQKLEPPDSPEQWLSEHNQILFSAYLGDSTNVWQIPLSSENWQVAGLAERLTFGAGKELRPASAADGQIVFVNQRENVDVWGLPVAINQGRVTGKLQQVTRNVLRETYPALSWDGRWLTFVAEDAERRDIWIKDLRSGKETALSAGLGGGNWPLVSPDGTQVAYGLSREGRHPAYLMPVGGGASKLFCDDCDRMSDWSPDGRWLLMREGQPRHISVFNFDSGQKSDLLRHNRYNMYQPHFSRDGRWVIFFLSQDGPELRRIYIAPFLPGRVLEEREWIAVTDGQHADDKPRLSPNGNLVYFTSNRDGFFCLWGQRLEAASKHPAGAPFPVYHFHNARLSPMNLLISQFELIVAPDRLILNMSELTGEVWLAQLRGQ